MTADTLLRRCLLPLDAHGVYRELMSRQSVLTILAAAMLALALPAAVLIILDDRTWREVAIWAKPLKFMLSTAAFAATTAWFVGLLPKSLQASPLVNRLAWVVVITSTFEVGYISLQAVLGQGSHHNTGDPLHAALFGLMAIAAVGLTATQAVLAGLIWRHSLERNSVFVRSVIVGLILTFALAKASGFMLGGQQPPAGTGLPLLGWHLGQADARPAHFLGVHAHQLIPLAGWLLQRNRVSHAGPWLSAFTVTYLLGWTLLTLWALR
ncbi:MAG: hypothetical protein NTW53_18285 [Burkholderiales bacterium]|nr:hypothetical protein [Burkholderiales bacterium]